MGRLALGDDGHLRTLGIALVSGTSGATFPFGRHRGRERKALHAVCNRRLASLHKKAPFELEFEGCVRMTPDELVGISFTANLRVDFSHVLEKRMTDLARCEHVRLAFDTARTMNFFETTQSVEVNAARKVDVDSKVLHGVGIIENGLHHHTGEGPIVWRFECALDVVIEMRFGKGERCLPLCVTEVLYVKSEDVLEPNVNGDTRDDRVVHFDLMLAIDVVGVVRARTVA